MSTVNDKLTPAQVADACRLYILRRLKSEGRIQVPDEAIMLGVSDIHFMKDDGTTADAAFDYVMISFPV